MKSIKLLCTTICVMASSLAYADESLIQEVNNADLGYLAEKATDNKKQLMMIYYKGQCKACDEVDKIHLSENTSNNKLHKEYSIYKTNISAGFDVVCPNGDMYSDQEFMSIKGISELPALVITDDEGNVTYVENNISDKHKLIAASKLFKKSYHAQNVADTNDRIKPSI